jgi:Cu(I)/Ag(I) efflux system membrane fusion protein
MNKLGKLILGALLLLAVAAAGYSLGTHNTSGDKEVKSATQAERKLLYYRNPMGLPDTSPVSKKDAMGMNYVAVYEGDEQATGVVSISTDKVQKLGVKSEAAILRVLNQTLRVTGRIEIDERHTYTIAPKFEGWVEQLYVNSTGQAVSKGQPLFDVYSPDLVSAQREHALAVQGLAALKDADADARAGMQRLVDASRSRLQNWDIATMKPAASASGAARPRVTFYAPVTGVVLEKKAVQGMRFSPGEALYQIADLSSVWVIAEVPEQEIASVKVGDVAQVGIAAYPEKQFAAKVDFIYPTLNNATRTVPVRLVIANPQGLIKPAMYAQVDLATGHNSKVLTVPTSAVIDSGIRQVVLVQLAAGRFEPRVVKLGSRSETYVEVLAGIAEGEQVVTSANFLIDAESNLKAALSGMDVSAAQSAVVQTKNTSKVIGHQAQGVLDAIKENGTVSITHQEIKSLGWPGMTMDFALANSALVAGIKPGSAITFELVERKPDEWVITKMQPAPQTHEGH